MPAIVVSTMASTGRLVLQHGRAAGAGPDPRA